MVFQDGHAYVGEEGYFRAPIVFDNLIHAGDMPVTVGIFINPGHVGDTPPASPWAGSLRSFEYDSLSDQYARFLIDEILPEVGARWSLTDDPSSARSAGCRPGGSARSRWPGSARTPSAKSCRTSARSPTSAAGTPTPRSSARARSEPLRVFLQDGEADQDQQAGNWWLANLQMVAALRYRGYDHQFVGGSGAHSGEHGGAILPDSLRWLWRRGRGRERRTAEPQDRGSAKTEDRTKAEAVLDIEATKILLGRSPSVPPSSDSPNHHPRHRGDR